MCNIPNNLCLCKIYVYGRPTRTPGFPLRQQLYYQPVRDCIYWPFLGSFNSWNIITFSPNSTISETFEEIHQVVLDYISVKYGLVGSIW